MVSENDLQVATQLGEIRATLKAIEHRLDMIGDYEERISALERTVEREKAKLVGMTLGMSSMSAVVCWVFLNWGRLMRLFS